MYRIETFGSVVAGQGAVSKAGTTWRVWVYAVDGALIDTGPAALRASFIPFVASLPFSVQQVALTHLHEDHCGMAAYMAARGVPVYVHRDYADAMATKPRLPVYRRVFWGVPEPFSGRPFGDGLATEKHRFAVVETPGHAREHVVLHERDEGWLFSGDLFVAPRVRTMMRHESPQVLMESIRRALALDFDTLFCAHAGIVADGKAALARRLQALEDIRGEVHRWARRGWTVRKVTRRLFPGFQPLTWLSLGEYSPAHIVRSFWPSDGSAEGGGDEGDRHRR